MESYYHCVSRVNGKSRSLREREKRHFHEWMRRLEEFCGVQVVTYCLMENHFHLLVRVPCRQSMVEAEPLTAGRLREMLPLIYRGRELRDALQELDRAEVAAQPSDLGEGSGTWLAEILDRYEARRYSLSIFLKELKQRYTRWHNRRHQRVGTLWENRFRSVLVEGDETALLTIAAYIDLNPVRAGIVRDPKDYRWCGYAEAVAGGNLIAGKAGKSGGQNAARRGLVAIFDRTSFAVNRQVTWRTAAPRYRMLLFGHGERRNANEQTGAKGRRGIRREVVEAELARGGELSVSEILRCKVRYLTEGVAIGGSEFLQQVFDENRERFGAKRSTAGKAMRGSNWGGLQVLRSLRCKVFE